MTSDRIQFLEYVQKYVEQDPYVAAYVTDYVHKALATAISAANERAADMETALAVLSAKRFKNRNNNSKVGKMGRQDRTMLGLATEGTQG